MVVFKLGVGKPVEFQHAPSPGPSSTPTYFFFFPLYICRVVLLDRWIFPRWEVDAVFFPPEGPLGRVAGVGETEPPTSPFLFFDFLASPPLAPVDTSSPLFTHHPFVLWYSTFFVLPLFWLGPGKLNPRALPPLI